MEVFKFLTESDYVTIELDKYDSLKMKVKIIGKKLNKQFRKMLDKNLSELSVQTNTGSYYYDDMARIPKLEYKEDVELMNMKRRDYDNKIKEILKQVDKLGCSIFNYNTKYPEDCDDNEEWYKYEERYYWSIYFKENGIFHKEIEKACLKNKIK